MLRAITRYYKRLKITFWEVSAATVLLGILFLPGYVEWEEAGDNLFTVYLNGTQVGMVGNTATAEEAYKEARKVIASKSEELVFIDVNMSMEGESVLWGKVDDEDTVKESMLAVMQDNIKETMQHSYVLKVNNYMVNLSGMEEVKQLMQAAVDQYDSEGKYEVGLIHDSTREFNVLTVEVAPREQKEEEEQTASGERHLLGGIQARMFEMFEGIEPAKEKEFADFDLGLVSMAFAEEVEIVEAYLDVNELTPLDVAVEEVTKEQEISAVYEIQPGDTLSQIAINLDITIDKIVEMNPNLENENSVIRAGDDLIITIPEPELSVDRQEDVYIEGSYEAEVVYIPNDSWYTTQTKTLQEPSAGFRKVIARVSYRNDAEVAREILKEEVVMEAVPKIVEKGTKIPPTYVKPIAGGIMRSGFGKRTAPTRGASSYHKGVDWAVPTGTSVMASCGGTVTKAGWGSGYGYVVYIKHSDGRETRYAHLSKVLVSAGQSVSQGQKIALSGNTGVSTGPHLHFEMLIGGSHVNPVKYLD